MWLTKKVPAGEECKMVDRVPPLGREVLQYVNLVNFENRQNDTEHETCQLPLIEHKTKHARRNKATESQFQSRDAGQCKQTEDNPRAFQLCCHRPCRRIITEPVRENPVRDKDVHCPTEFMYPFPHLGEKGGLGLRPVQVR